ncbi:class I SAM-dependent methyltransferase [Actinoplanes sp. NPDC051851]|uniref:class I SAM-dependent methyltransferase n=1 Tax=Actinoplanes sp. NPDC051851 TaxID=3154753 RepID=UPI0034306931
MWHGELRDPRLVQVYDAECPWGWEDDFFMAVLAEKSAPRVLDMGCGTGRLAVAMARAGHEVTAVDPSGPALEAARAQEDADLVHWIRADPDTADLPARTYDTAFLTGYVVQRFAGDDHWEAVLRALRRALVTEGRLVFHGRDPAGRAWEDWHSGNTRAVVLPDGTTVTAWTEVTGTDERSGLVAITNHYLFADGRRLADPIRLRFRTEAELRESLRAAGFRVDTVYGGWGREPVGLGSDGELIVIAAAAPRLMS